MGNTKIPTFNVSDSGRVDITVYRMDGGFLIQNNDDNSQYAVSDLEEINAIISTVADSIKEEIRSFANDTSKRKFDYVDIGVQLIQAQQEAQRYVQEDAGPMEVSMDQLAEYVNDLLETNPIARRGGRLVITPAMIQGVITGQKGNRKDNFIIKRPRIVEKEIKAPGVEKYPDNPNKKKFFDPNKKQNDKSDGSEKDKGNETTIIS